MKSNWLTKRMCSGMPSVSEPDMKMSKKSSRPMARSWTASWLTTVAVRREWCSNANSWGRTKVTEYSHTRYLFGRVVPLSLLPLSLPFWSPFCPPPPGRDPSFVCFLCQGRRIQFLQFLFIWYYLFSQSLSLYVSYRFIGIIQVNDLTSKRCLWASFSKLAPVLWFIKP